MKAVLVILYGLAVSTSLAASQERFLSEAVIDDLKRRVSDLLNDPESARFRNLQASERPAGTLYVCGEINGKNKFGGYVGYRLFVAAVETVADQAQWSIRIDDGENAEFITDTCEAVGIFPSGPAPKSDNETAGPKTTEQVPKEPSKKKKAVQDRLPSQ